MSSQGHKLIHPPERPLLDTLERVRGCFYQPGQPQNPRLQQYFMTYAEMEGRPANQIPGISREICD